MNILDIVEFVGPYSLAALIVVVGVLALRRLSAVLFTEPITVVGVGVVSFGVLRFVFNLDFYSTLFLTAIFTRFVADVIEIIAIAANNKEDLERLKESLRPKK